MTVAFDAATESGTWTASPVPYTFTHTPVSGSVRGVVLQIVHGVTSADRITGSVTYGGVVMTRVDTAANVAGEYGRAYTYFLGAGIPQGVQTISIGHSAASGIKIATLISLTAAADTEIVTLGKLVGLREDPQILLGTGATSALRLSLIYSGLGAVANLTLLSGMTAVHSHDYGNYVTRTDRQTVASSGPYTIGYESAIDDVAMVAVAVQEIPAEVPEYDFLISGDTALTIGPGQTGYIDGDVNLVGDLIVEGNLTGIDTFTVEGNGSFQVLVQNGGEVQLAGVEKTAWTNWGETVVGWEVGDRLAVAPTAQSIYVPSEITWAGSWGATTRPANSPDFTLLDASVVKPEVVNLSQTVIFQNMRRGFHFHDGAAVQSLKWMRIFNSGVAGVVGEYSLHFHLNGEESTGSIVEGVVIEGSLNHSFVPHGSHGITMLNCAAYRAKPGAFWWDPPPDADKRSAINNSDDTTWDHCLVLYVLGGTSTTAEGFSLGAGLDNKLINSAVSCTVGGKSASGVHWPGHASQNVGGNVWEFHDNVVHNNRNAGVFIWQNGSDPFADDHLNEDFIMYNIGRQAWNHGAYANNYTQKRMVIQNAGEHAIGMHAIGLIRHEDVLTNGSVLITIHNIETATWVEMLRCTFTKVVFNSNEWEAFPSFTRWTDCLKAGGGALAPADFVSHPTLVPISTTPGGIHPDSIIEIFAGASLTNRWAAGAWT